MCEPRRRRSWETWGLRSGFVLQTNHNGAGELNLPSNLPIYPRPDTLFSDSSPQQPLRGRRDQEDGLNSPSERGRRRGTGAILSPCERRVAPAGLAPALTGREARPGGRRAAGCCWFTLAGERTRQQAARRGRAGAEAGTAQGGGPGIAARPSRSPGQLRRGGCGTWLRARAKLVLSRSCRDAPDGWI